jgi:hypothetical protein
MTDEAESYLKKAEQFEAMARSAKDEAAKITYEHLAWSYRQLGLYVSREGVELDGLVERIVPTPKEAS